MKPSHSSPDEHISIDGPPSSNDKGSSIEELKTLVHAPMLPTLEEDLYEKKADLGKGGLGQVSRMVDKRLMREIALKQLLPNKEKAKERFLREALITARLQHPSIVSVYEVGFWPSGDPFYTMKMISGQPLKEVIEKTSSLNERLALLPHILDVCEAIAYAHSKHIIHRDLKPQNILIGEFGETVVIDWGVAKDLNTQAPHQESFTTQEMLAVISDTPATNEGGSHSSSSDLTLAGAILGTPAYMPPEQAKGNPVDERADVYSLGAILYHLLAGVPPYSGTHEKVILRQVLQGPPISLQNRQHNIPRDLVSITQKAMARESHSRYESAKELANDLKKFLTGQLVSAYQYTSSELFWRWIARYRAAVVVALLLSFTLAVSLVVSFQKITQERNSAQQSQQEAETQRAVSDTLNEQLLLKQARAFLERSPVQSLSWLKQLHPERSPVGTVRTIAADALLRGIPIYLPTPSPARLMTFSRDKKWMAVALEDRSLLLWDVSCSVPPCGEPRRLGVHDEAISALVFSPDSQWIASAGSNTDIVLWPVVGGEKQVLSGHTKAVSSLLFSSDSKKLISASNDTTIRIWELQNKQSRLIEGHQNIIGELVLSPDNKMLASISWDNNARLFDVDSGSLLLSQPVVGGGDIQFSPSGQLIAIASDDGNVYLWSHSDNIIKRLQGHENVVTRVRFSPDGQRLASASWDHTVRVWGLSDTEPTSKVLFGHEQNIQHLEFSLDGTLLASAGQDQTIRLWDVSQSPIVPNRNRALRGPESSVGAISFSPDGRFLASTNDDTKVRLWRVAPHERQTLRGHGGDVRDVTFSPDGSSFVTSGDDRLIRIWSTQSPKEPTQILAGHTDAVMHVAFSSDGKQLASVGARGGVFLWNLTTGLGIQISAAVSDDSQWGSAPINDLLSSDLARFVECHVMFSPKGDVLAFSSLHKGAQILSLSDKKLRSLDAHQTPISQLRFSPDGRWLATASHDGQIFIHQLGTIGHKTLSAHQDPIYSLEFSPDSRTLASAGYDSIIRLWNIESGEHKELKAHKSAVLHVAFSPDGKSLASGSFDQSAILWDLASLSFMVLEGHKRRVYRVLFSPDSQSLATSSFDSTIRLWDISTRESRVLHGHVDEVYEIDFSPDGKWLLSGGRDDMAYLWADDLPKDSAAFWSWLQKTVTPLIDPTR
jgi:WD40 repeat protein